MDEYIIILLLIAVIVLLVAVVFFVMKEYFKQRKMAERRRRHKPSPFRKAGAALIIIIIATAIIFFLLPRGRNSLWDKNGDSQAELTGGETDEKREEDTVIDGIMSVTVKESTVTINGKSFLVTEQDDSGLSEYISGLDLLGVSVRLKEDYAVSFAYHYVEDVLIYGGAVIVTDAEQ